jgi:hypothetical protein
MARLTARPLAIIPLVSGMGHTNGPHNPEPGAITFFKESYKFLQKNIFHMY